MVRGAMEKIVQLASAESAMAAHWRKGFEESGAFLVGIEDDAIFPEEKDGFRKLIKPPGPEALAHPLSQKGRKGLMPNACHDSAF
jgi:hypothetical protein